MSLKLLPLLFAVFLFLSCSKSETINEELSLSRQIDNLIEDNEYEEALFLLHNEDHSDPEIRTLLEKTHLNYGYHSMNTFDQTEMRTRMNNALTQFIEVLKINPENQTAREQIDQIMSVYATMPNRSPREDVLEGLRELGMNY